MSANFSILWTLIQSDIWLANSGKEAQLCDLSG